MNGKITIPIVIGVVILIVGITVIINPGSNTTKNEEIDEIQNKLNEIEKTKSENEYKPKSREWITSGPFQIDRSEYILGEKIFLRIGGLTSETKGEIVFHRPVKSIDDSIYITIPFDGTKKDGFNYFIEPRLSKIKGFCTTDDFIGDWTIVFRGTNYESIGFKITENILPGEEEEYQPVC
ncbi:MAG: hypothetical protein ACPGQP_00125 [Nitrosopumilus sp.]